MLWLCSFAFPAQSESPHTTYFSGTSCARQSHSSSLCATRKLGQTHHSHPVELHRLSSRTPHRFRRMLAIGLSRTMHLINPTADEEGCCLKGVNRLQGITSASTSFLRSQSSCLRHSSQMWLDRYSSGLPTDSCPNSPVREFCQLIVVHTSPVRSPARVSTQPSPEVRAYPRSPDSTSRPIVGSFKQSPRCDQSVFTLLRVALCLLLFFSLFFSCHGPLTVRSAHLFHRSSGFTQFCTRLDVHNQSRQLSVSFCFTQACATFLRSLPPAEDRI